MILSYSVKSFEQSLRTGVKKHTLRADPKKRWKAGMKINQWMGSPRNGGRFLYDDRCQSVQEVRIQCDLVDSPPPYIKRKLSIYVDGRLLSWNEMLRLIQNDGLDYIGFLTFFFKHGQIGTWTGRIIHFTDLKY